MSLILKFETDEDREKFLDLVRRDKPELMGQLAPNPLLPLAFVPVMSVPI